MCIDDLNIEFEELKSPESVDSAPTATRISHDDWLHIESDNVVVEKSLANLLSSGRAQKEKEKLETEKKMKTIEAWEKYHKQGEPRKSDHHTQTDLIQIYQIWTIVV